LIEPIYKPPFRDASLDGIGCFTTREIENPWETVVLEFARVLKPGGRIFVGAPFLQKALFVKDFIIDQLYVDNTLVVRRK
jgi:ubiquinone/menaquinone biosynthesis C-methylase UbiE